MTHSLTKKLVKKNFMNKIIGGLVLVVFSFCFSSCSLLKSKRGKKTGKPDTTAIADTQNIVSQPATAQNGKPLSDTALLFTARTKFDTLKVIPDSSVVKTDSTAFFKERINEINPIWKNRLSYRTFAGRAKVHYEGTDNNFDFTANFRMRKDSVIWIEISAQGALGGLFRVRILVTRDSLFMVNYIQREVTILSLLDAEKVLPSKVDFSSLQNLITGEPLREGVIKKVESSPNTWMLRVEDTGYIQQITYSKADSNMISAVMNTLKPNGPSAKSEYSNYELSNNRRISKTRVLNLQNGADTYELDMEFQKIEFDEPLEYPFNIPKNFSVK